jgi:hypothetical protein
MRHTDKNDLRVAILRGARAGALGAVAMGLFMMLVTASRAGGFWTTLQLIGASVLGDEHRSAGAAVLGLFIHLAVGATLGAIYALLARRQKGKIFNVMLALVFGVAVFAPMTYLLLPIVDPIMYRTIHLGVLFMGHVVYGLVTGLAMGALNPAAEERREGFGPRTTATT